MNKLFVLLAALISSTASAAVSDVDRAILDRGKQLLLNGGFESGKASWTASGGTFTTTTTAANVGFGAVAASWNSSAASQTLVSSLVSIPSGLKSNNGFAYCRFKAASGTATHTITVDDGTNNLVAPQTIVSSTSTYKGIGFNFIYPSSGQVRIKIASVAADEPEIFIDDCFVGDAINVGSVAQAKLVGTISVSGCTSQWSTTSTTFASYATQTGCSYTVTGQALAPTTNIPAIRFDSLPAGDYRLEYEGTAGNNTANKNAFYQFFDGTNTSRETTVIGGSAGASFTGTLQHTISYTSPQSNVTLQIRGKADSASTNQIYGTTTYPGVIKVFYFPSSDQQVYNPTLDTWKVDANISGANPSLGVTALTSYTGITNASLSLTNNSGQGNIAAEIPCSTTNPSTGDTCSVGDESVGVAFNLPKAGDVQACVSFGHNIATGTSGIAYSIFQIVETPNNAQTILQEGKSRVPSGIDVDNTRVRLPNRICGVFSFSSSGKKTLRLMYEQQINATVNENFILGDASATAGQEDIHWEVYPISQLTPAPVLVGSVTSGTSGAERIERVSITSTCTSSPCTIASQSGSWVTSITRQGIGLYTVNYNSDTFSSAPTCLINPTVTSTPAALFAITTIPSTTSFQVNTKDSAFTNSERTFSIICMGPK